MTDGTAANQALGALTESLVGAVAVDGTDPAEPLPLQALLVLRAGARWLALPADAVREVVLKSFVTRIPLSPPQVLGVTLVRGRLLPVVALELMLPGSQTDELAATLPRLVVIETKEVEAAIVADEVHGIVEFAPHYLRDQAPLTVRPAWIEAEISWEDRLLCLLQPQRLIAAALEFEESR